MVWKKALWVYLGLAVLGVIYLLINYTVTSIQADEFYLSGLLGGLFLLFPIVMLALALRGQKVALAFLLISLLITAVPVAGILNFNEMGLATLAKVLIFLPMLAGLVYFGYRRVVNH